MIRLTQINGLQQPIFIRAEAVYAIVPAPHGCRVVGLGWQAEVSESAMKVHTLISNEEKRVVRKAHKATSAAA